MICSEPQCNNKYVAKGLCSRHYQFKYKNDPKHILMKKRWYINNKAKSKDDHRKWVARNPEYYKNYQKKYYKKYSERIFKINRNQLEKFGKIFDMNSQEYLYALNSWSKVVKKRDKCCKICGLTKNLNAHHIFFKKFIPQLSLNLSNGITLCKSCHEELHGFKIYKV